MLEKARTQLCFFLSSYKQIFAVTLLRQLHTDHCVLLTLANSSRCIWKESQHVSRSGTASDHQMSTSFVLQRCQISKQGLWLSDTLSTCIQSTPQLTWWAVDSWKAVCQVWNHSVRSNYWLSTGSLLGQTLVGEDGVREKSNPVHRSYTPFSALLCLALPCQIALFVG